MDSDKNNRQVAMSNNNPTFSRESVRYTKKTHYDPLKDGLKILLRAPLECLKWHFRAYWDLPEMLLT